MGVDLKIQRWFHRESLVLWDDCLIQLEHEMIQDRVRRIFYEQVESVVAWKVAPWAQIVIVLILLGLPGLLILLFNEIPAYVIGGIILALAAILLLRYLLYRKTLIRIRRAGEVKDFAAIASPARINRFLRRLRAGIDQAQGEAKARQAAREAESPAAAPPLEEPGRPIEEPARTVEEPARTVEEPARTVEEPAPPQAAP
ncbi:MAG: hypothetical protein HY717_10425 [Planctomycetes bacterium]|nr:hypothetical protein [Planctomycetota bacterium]